MDLGELIDRRQQRRLLDHGRVALEILYVGNKVAFLAQLLRFLFKLLPQSLFFLCKEEQLVARPFDALNAYANCYFEVVQLVADDVKVFLRDILDQLERARREAHAPVEDEERNAVARAPHEQLEPLELVGQQVEYELLALHHAHTDNSKFRARSEDRPCLRSTAAGISRVPCRA